MSSISWSTFNYFRIGEGSHESSGLYNFGAGNPAVKSKNSTYRSLGSLNDASNRCIMYGMLMENNTGCTITALDIAYTGKVWRVGSSAAAVDTLSFGYVVLTAPANIRALRDRTKYLGDFRVRNATQLDFVTPTSMSAKIDGTVAAKIDGDNEANQTRLSATLSVTIQPGEVVLLRWTDLDEGGADQALAIDDVVVTATLEGEGIENVRTTEISSQKQLRNGQLIIIRNGVTYDATGRRL